MEIQRGRKPPKLYPLLINCFLVPRTTICDIQHLQNTYTIYRICDMQHLQNAYAIYRKCDISHMHFVNVAYRIWWYKEPKKQFINTGYNFGGVLPLWISM